MTGYDVLYVEKTGGAVVLGKKAYTFATGSTGAGGYLYGEATSKGWHDVSFEHVVGVGLSLPTGNPGKTYPTTIFRATGTVIGGATPTGDLRGEGTGFVGIGNSNPYNFQKDTDYSGALFAIYRGTQDFSGKIGVGTTMGAIAASGYYDGNFKSKDIHEFANSFTPNTGDLSVIPTGSGIYLRSNRVGVRNAIVSRAGNTLTTPQALRADALVSGQRISITDISGNVVADNFRNYTNPSFTLTHDQNVDIFGSYRKNFGIRNEIIGYDTGVHTSQVNLYGNTLSIRDIYVQASGKLEKNQSTGNLTMPNTGGMSAADAKNAIKGFNGQLIAESGCTGYIAVQAFWNENMANCEPHQMGVWAGNSGNFVANRKSYLGSYELPRKPSFTVQFYPNDASAANVNFSSGTWFEFASSSRVGRDSQRFRVGGEEGYRLENPLEEYAQYLRRYGHVAIKSGDLVVSGKDAGGFYANTYSGSGDGYRITAPNGNVYLVSGDDPGDFCYCTLQEVVSNGNTSTTDIYMNGSSLFYINSYIRHVGDANSYFGFPDNDEFRLVTNGQARLDFTSDGATMYDPLGKSAVEIGKGGYSLQSESSSIISAYNSVINSTGCLIGAGSGHQISGDYDVIAGGVTNNISGGDFNFIGGGSGIDVTGADYCSSLGGYNNDIKSSDYSVIAGGYDNLVSGAGAAGAVVGGGFSNIIKAGSAVIAGGQSNTVHEGGNYSFIGAGGSNIIRGQNNVIAGGINQEISGDMAVIIGGSDNKVEADRGVVGGNHSYVQEWHTGAFVFSDSSATHALSTGADTLNLHFAEGVYVESTSGLYVNGNAVSTGSAGGSDTFGTVSARGNTTTTSIGVQGQYLSGVSGVFESVDITGTATLTVTGSVQGTGIGNRITNNHVPYLLSGDVTISELGLGTAATKDVGISNNNVIQANNTLVDNDFLRIDGTQVEGRSASEVLSDIGGQASLTFGISNTNAVKIDSASVADDEYARFTSAGLESRSTSEVLSDIGAQASLTFGISNTNAVKIDSASVADDEYARFTSNGLESRSTSEVKSDIGLSANDSPTFNGLIVTGAAGISGGANFLGTGVGNRITAENGKVYLVSGDVESDTNNYLDSATFNTANGVLTLGREGLSDVTVDLDGRFTDNTHADAMNQGVATTDSPTFNGLKSTGAAGISGGANFIGTGIGNRLTAENGKPYLISGDVTTSELGLGTAATKDVGISNNNVIQANNTLVDNDFLRIDGTQVEGRSASEVLSDIGGQASLTFGISNTNAVKIDSASVADDEYARFTSAGLESRSTSEVLSDIGGVADGGSPTFNSIYLQNTIFHDGDTDTRIDVSADTIQLATAGTTALTVASNSNVGIGTAVPNAAYKLHTQGLNYATGMVVGGGIAGYTPSENGLIVEGKAAVGYYSPVSTLGVYGGASV